MHIATTRFNKETLQEHQNWCIAHEFKGAIINASKHISKSIPPNDDVCVIHMLNLKPKQNDGCGGTIVGFSIIKNRPVYSHNENYGYIFDNFHIYSDGNYNRVTYMSDCYFPIEEFTTLEDKKTIGLLEEILFYGKGNMKRGEGITKMPDYYLTKNELDFFKKMQLIKLNYNNHV